MKQCPDCRTTYTDDTLKYCLADGSPLAAVQDEQPTLVRPDNMRINIGDEGTQSGVTPAGPVNSGTNWLKIVVAAVVIMFLLIAVLGIAGAIFYYSGQATVAVNSNKPTPTATPKPSPSATVDDEKQKLQEQLANLQRKIDEQKRTDSNTSAPPKPPDTSQPTARVSSPADGFLALRSEPDSERGQRLARIPHGTVIQLNNCEKQKTTVAGKSGRWCMVTYQDTAGWVFDAWLIY